MSERDHIVIGLGSGRCGTRSLSVLLRTTHEAQALPWEYSEPFFKEALKLVEKSGGDTGFYWLNYVDRMLQVHPDTRFVCLKRPREETTRSWKSRFRGHERFDLWVMYFDAVGRVHAPLVFPDYLDLTIEEAANRYWDDYYERAGRLQERYPDHFRIFWMDKVLNDRKHQKQMLRFAGADAKAKTNTKKADAPDDLLELKNALVETLGTIVRNERIYRGGKVTLTPNPGSRVGKLAVKHGVSDSETDDIVFDLSEAERASRELWRSMQVPLAR